MAGSLEEVGAGPGGDAVRRFLALTHNDDGSRISDVLVTDAYASPVTPDASAGGWHTITATDNTALTINAPTNPPAAARTGTLVIEIANASGGAMGNVTWDSAFVFVGLTFTKPGNGKARFARFQWNGTSWICQGVAGADY